MKKLALTIFTLFLFVLSLDGCATVRKLNAASILQNTTLELHEVTLDSVSINPGLFEKVGEALKNSILPNPQVVTLVQNLARGIIEKDLGNANLGATVLVTSRDEDSLWIVGFDAKLMLDTLMELPVVLKDSCILAPGPNKIFLAIELPLDKRIFELAGVRKYRIKGVLDVALKADGEKVALDFDIEHAIAPEEIKNLEDSIRQTILNSLIGDWVNALLPEE